MASESPHLGGRAATTDRECSWGFGLLVFFALLGFSGIVSSWEYGLRFFLLVLLVSLLLCAYRSSLRPLARFFEFVLVVVLGVPWKECRNGVFFRWLAL
jgi:hypothetical protein